MEQNDSSQSELMATNTHMMPLRKKSSASLYTVALLIPIYIGRITEFKSLESLGIGKIAFFIAFIIYLFSPKNEAQKIATFWSLPQMRYLVYLFLWSIISIPFSIWPGSSVGTIIGFSKVLIFVFLVVLSINDKQDLEVLTWILILSVFGLVITSVVSPKFVEVSNRVTAPIQSYDPNDFALLIVMTLAVVYYFIWNNSGFKKVLLILIFIAMCFSLIRTASRGGILAFSVVVFAILLKKGLSRTLILLPIITIAVTFLMMLAGHQYYARLETLLHAEDDYNMSSKSGRIEIWKRGIKMVLENPIVGVGPGNFRIAEGKMHDGGKWSVSHNSFLEVGGELGFPGLFLFLLIIVHSVLLMRKNNNNDTHWLSNGLEVGLYGFSVGGFFLAWEYSYILYFYIGLSAAILKLGNLHKKAEDKLC